MMTTTMVSVCLLSLIVGVLGNVPNGITKDVLYSKKENILHSSPYSGIETTCGGRPCVEMECASACVADDSCRIFSHNPATGACVLSRRPDDDPNDYDSGSPAWNSFYRVCPTHRGFVLDESVQPPLCVRYVDQAVQQSEAKAACQQLQTNLVRVKNMDVYNVVKNILIDAGHNNWMWVGAEDRETEGEHYWNDGTRLYRGTSMWFHSSEGYGAAEDCIGLTYYRKLADLNCGFRTTFMCQ